MSESLSRKGIFGGDLRTMYVSPECSGVTMEIVSMFVISRES